MRIRPSSTHRCCAIARLGAPLLLLLPFLCLGDQAPAEPGDPWASVDAALRTLWTGTPSGKRVVAENAYFAFGPLFGSDQESSDEHAPRTLASLRSFLRSGMDDFVSYRLLSELADREDEILTPLFVDVLKSPSPNLRAAAIHWFSGHAAPDALPDLEDRFRHEDRPWVKADLMIALVRNGSREDARDFLDLARGKDATLALAAIRALTMLGDPEVVPFLAKIARTSPSNAGLLALDALSRWPDSRDALDAVLQASRSPRIDFRRHAAQILGSFDDPAAAARALEMAELHGDSDVRAAALGSLTSATGVDPLVLRRIALQILREAPTPENAPAQSAAVATLRDLDDPAVLAELVGLEFSPGDSRSFELRWLKEHLGRPREEQEGDRRRVVRTKEVTTDVILKVEEEETWTIVAPPTMLTVRCWEAPDVPGDPHRLPRLPGGKEVEVKDHFEQERESWVRLDERDCWVPLRFIEAPAAPPASHEQDKEEAMIVRREFDLPASEVESDVAQGLMDAGLLEIIEPGDEVIGVALTIDPADFDRVLLLARSCGLNETMLDGEIYEIVADLAPLYRGHPVFDRFRRAPGIQTTNTDEVIDLDIDELTDN